ncbi:hypothetical protein [Paenibacillus dendritiformis]|uniref:hypothetical protein n=1 Tax=Paenibacillus dendritiformis TaxID=130049 RepID=UPI00387E0848
MTNDTVYKAAYLAKTIVDSLEEPDMSPVLFFTLRLEKNHNKPQTSLAPRAESRLHPPVWRGNG